MNVGVAGLGRMGTAIALRLLEQGHRVTVWNRTAAKTRPVTEAGATAVTAPAGLLSGCDVIVTMLTDSAALERTFRGEGGLLTADVTGKLFIDMSTVPPATAIAIADAVRARRGAYVECPVGGTTGPARQGKLLGLMGAEPADAERALPLLTQLCRRVEHVGPVGNGALMKLAINLPLMVAWQAYGEAFALARDAGLPPERLVDLIADTSGANNALKNRVPALVSMLNGGDEGAVTFNLDGGAKDLRAMLAEGAARGVALPLTEGALGAFEEASAHGLGGRDNSALAVYWSRRGQKS